jgi:hypothetical protein
MFRVIHALGSNLRLEVRYPDRQTSCLFIVPSDKFWDISLNMQRQVPSTSLVSSFTIICTCYAMWPTEARKLCTNEESINLLRHALLIANSCCSNTSKWIDVGRSQWPRGLRHELSSPAQTLRTWVRIPLKAWMLVCIYSVFVQVAVLRRADPPSKESYRLCKRSRNWKSSQGPTKDYRAIDR